MIERTSVLGGEVSSRGLLGGTWSRARVVGLGITAPVAAVLTISLQMLGLAIGLAGVGVVFVATMRTPQGSPWARAVARWRWRERTRTGTVRFTPFDAERWDALTCGSATGGDLDPVREAAAMRAAPDGVQGMRWLQQGPGVPGIAWHAPTGEAAWLSVAFAVTGAVRGLAPDVFLEQCAQGFGRALASWGGETSLPRRLQTITRVLPVDSAMHEHWVMDNLDPSAPGELLASYDQLVGTLGSGSLHQRHYAVVRWPLETAFLAAAAKHGPGPAGWRVLMGEQIRAARRTLVGARVGEVRVLSAAETAAVLRHMQDPSFPIDQAGDLTPDTCWLPSSDEWSATVIANHTGTGPGSAWWHRTAVIPIASVSTAPRTALWLMPLLGAMSQPVIRTVSLQVEVEPARQARARARADATTDTADLHKQAAEGQIDDSDLVVQLSGAKRRLRDLRAGSNHHGVAWAGHVTITARDREGLAVASRQVEEAADRAGIEALAWLDTYQGAAMACTWPVARGMTPVKSSRGTRVRKVVGGRGRKEAL